jgi:predicted transcriptional regulator
MNYEKVLEHSNLIRDPTTGAIINTDKIGFTETKNIRNNISSLKKMQNEIDYLKSEILEIKNLLLEHITRHG